MGKPKNINRRAYCGDAVSLTECPYEELGPCERNVLRRHTNRLFTKVLLNEFKEEFKEIQEEIEQSLMYDGKGI